MNDMALELPSGEDARPWVNALPAYQQSVLRKMLEVAEPEDVAAAWLGATGHEDTATYGSVRLGASLFYRNLLEELRSLLCEPDGAYLSERTDLVATSKAGHAAVVTFVSGTLAPAVGVSPVLIAPAVALTLFVLARAGRETACELLDGMIASREAGGS